MAPLSILYVSNTDPTARVKRHVEGMGSDVMHMEISQLASLHDNVQNGLRMMYQMERVLRPTTKGIAVIGYDLTEMPTNTLVEQCLTAAKCISFPLFIIAGVSRAALGRVQRCGASFDEVVFLDDVVSTQDVANRLRDVKGPVLHHLVATDTSKSDLAHALISIARGPPAHHLKNASIMARAYYEHALQLRDLSTCRGDEDDGFRLGSPSFAFMLGCWSLLVVHSQEHSRTIDPLAAPCRGASLGRYEKAAYMFRKKLLAKFPSHLTPRASCVAAVMGLDEPQPTKKKS